MFSDYQAPGGEPREPYVYGERNRYPFAHIHATNTASPAPDAAPAPRVQPFMKRTTSAGKLGLAAPVVPVRPQAGPLTRQMPGHGPFHSTRARPEQRRLDFSKPKTEVHRPLSQLDERAAREVAASTEMPAADTIRLFTRTHALMTEAAAQARSCRTGGGGAVYMQSENNDPLSSHADVSLERYTHERTEGSNALEYVGPQQAQISAGYIATQTALRRASKAEQLEQYHRDVQERLNKRVQADRKKESQRRTQLPSNVKALVYDMHTPHTDSPAQERAQEVPQQDDSSPASHGLARMNLPLPYHESAAPSPAIVHAWSQQTASGTARPQSGSHTARLKSRLDLMTPDELSAYRLQVRKAEIERERMLAQKARASNPNLGASSGSISARGRMRERHAFGSALSRTPSPFASSPPRPTPRGAICQAEERDDLHRNPRSFVVKQQTEEQEAAQEGAVVHVPSHLAAEAARAKKGRMSAAVAGRKLPKKRVPKATDATNGVGGAGAAAEKNAAYRRLLLERLHAVSLTLNHPLPPLCACGFTPAEEYELYGNFNKDSVTSQQSQQPQQAAPGQLPFNLSTLIAAQPAAASIHHTSASAHSHAHTHASQSSSHQLPAHVALDSTRHAFAHKHNCAFYNAPDAYVKALANLLHTLEDQQQI